MDMIMTVSEFAAHHDVSRAAVYNWIKNGMPLHREHPKLVHLEEASNWLESRDTTMEKPKMYKPGREAWQR